MGTKICPAFSAHATWHRARRADHDDLVQQATFSAIVLVPTMPVSCRPRMPMVRLLIGRVLFGVTPPNRGGSFPVCGIVEGVRRVFPFAHIVAQHHLGMRRTHTDDAVVVRQFGMAGSELNAAVVLCIAGQSVLAFSHNINSKMRA
jgi:hypothetical protein